MRLREDAMDGRRSRVRKSPSIPKYGLASPFKGHLSTKSNAFSIGSSGRLIDQYQIQVHMMAHYDKVLSAKAAIDSSMPKSMLTSIKYSDQQHREKLKKEVAKYEREFPSARSLSRPNSGASTSQGSSERRKSSYEVQKRIDAENGQMYCTRSLLSPPVPYPVSPSMTVSTDSAKKLSGTYHKTSTPRKHFYAVSVSSSEGSLKCSSNFQRFQDPQKKTYSGDLLDLHSDQFTCKQQQFTPRTLKTGAKSVLAQYRYYSPGRRKKKDKVSEAEAQTEISSFKKQIETSEKKDVLEESQSTVDEDEYSETALAAEDVEEQMVSFQASENLPGWKKLVDHPYSLSRVSSSNSLKSPSPVMRKIKTEEEELLYLEFVAQITNEILTLGLFSSRVLARVFERHIEDNKHRLDEGKMRHLLDILRMDLGYKAEENSGVLNDNSDIMAALQEDISKTTQHPRYQTKNGGEYTDNTGCLRTEETQLPQQRSENYNHTMEYLKEDPRDSLSDKMEISLAIDREKYSHLKEFLNPAWHETESSALYMETPDISVTLQKYDNCEDFLQKGPRGKKPLSPQDEALTLQKYCHLQELLNENSRLAPIGEMDSYLWILQEGSPNVTDTIGPTLNTAKHDSDGEKKDEPKELCEETLQHSKEKEGAAHDNLVQDRILNLAKTGSKESGTTDRCF